MNSEISVLDNAKSVCAIIPRKYLTLVRKRKGQNSDVYVIKRREYEKLRQRRFVRPDCYNDYAAISRMDGTIGNLIHNPSLAIGTGFLIRDSIVMTAAHCLKAPTYPENQCCVNDLSCPNQIDGLAFVFGFEETDRGQHTLQFDANQVYFGELIRGRCTGVADWAAVRLNDSVPSDIAKPVESLDVNGTAKLDEIEYYILGHPLGVPKIYSGNGSWLYDGPSPNEPYFIDINSLRGNSGSPIFDSKTGMVVGMIVGGDEKLPGEDRTLEIWNYGCGCLNYDPTVKRGERIQRIKPICDVLPYACEPKKFDFHTTRAYKRRFQPNKSRKMARLEEVTLLPHVYHYSERGIHYISVIAPDPERKFRPGNRRLNVTTADEDGHKFLDITFEKFNPGPRPFHFIPPMPFRLEEGQSLVVRTLIPAPEANDLYIEKGRRVVHSYQVDHPPLVSALDSVRSLPHVYAAKFEGSFFVNVIHRIDDEDGPLAIRDIDHLTQPFNHLLASKDTSNYRIRWYEQTSDLDQLMDLEVTQFYPGNSVRGKGTIRYGDADEKPDKNQFLAFLKKFSTFE